MELRNPRECSAHILALSTRQSWPVHLHYPSIRRSGLCSRKLLQKKRSNKEGEELQSLSGTNRSQLTNRWPEYSSWYSHGQVIDHILGPLLGNGVRVGQVADEAVLQVVERFLVH